MLQLGTLSRRLNIQAIIRFYNATTEEETLAIAASLSEILRQIDVG